MSRAIQVPSVYVMMLNTAVSLAVPLIGLLMNFRKREIEPYLPDVNKSTHTNIVLALELFSD